MTTAQEIINAAIKRLGEIQYPLSSPPQPTSTPTSQITQLGLSMTVDRLTLCVDHLEKLLNQFGTPFSASWPFAVTDKVPLMDGPLLSGIGKLTRRSSAKKSSDLLPVPSLNLSTPKDVKAARTKGRSQAPFNLVDMLLETPNIKLTPYMRQVKKKIKKGLRSPKATRGKVRRSSSNSKRRKASTGRK